MAMGKHRAKPDDFIAEKIQGFRPMTGLVTAEEAQAAVQYLIDSAAEYAAARADAEQAAHMLRVVKAMAMQHSGQKSAAMQERDAYVSSQYADALSEARKATLEAEKLKALREAAKMRIEFWRSLNAGLRAGERGMHA